MKPTSHLEKKNPSQHPRGKEKQTWAGILVPMVKRNWEKSPEIAEDKTARGLKDAPFVTLAKKAKKNRLTTVKDCLINSPLESCPICKTLNTNIFIKAPFHTQIIETIKSDTIKRVLETILKKKRLKLFCGLRFSEMGSCFY